MLHVEYTTKFKRDLKLAKRRNKDIPSLQDIMKKIEHEKPLEPRLKDHVLTGNWVGYRELHIEPDWLLIYKLISDEKVVIFVRTGTHSDLFK
jgi:mRNA interferase YafQ